MKSREFWILSDSEYPDHRRSLAVHEEVFAKELAATEYWNDEIIHVREVVPNSTKVKPKIDWDKVWKCCDWRNLDEEDCDNIQELVEKQLSGEE